MRGTTAQFLEVVFGKSVGPERHVVVFTLPGARSRGFSRIDEAACYAGTQADRFDVYVGAGLYGSRTRGSAEDVSALVGLWADIDFAGPVHKKVNLPRNEAEALGFVHHLPCQASVIVHSGHGLQCWWLFREAVLIRSAAERRVAAALARGWIDHIRSEARKAGGWDMDATGDLARVLRLPGTMNYKGIPAVPVRVLEPQNMAGTVVRYDPGDFLALANWGGAMSGRQWRAGHFRLSPDARPPAGKFACLLAENEKFRESWERSRKDLQDRSPSAFDMSLASIAAANGWEDQEIVDLLIAARRAHGDDLKLRQDYYRRSVARARSRSSKGGGDKEWTTQKH